MGEGVARAHSPTVHENPRLKAAAVGKVQGIGRHSGQ